MKRVEVVAIILSILIILEPYFRPDVEGYLTSQQGTLKARRENIAAVVKPVVAAPVAEKPKVDLPAPTLDETTTTTVHHVKDPLTIPPTIIHGTKLP
jgi:hypothetical protein